MKDSKNTKGLENKSLSSLGDSGEFTQHVFKDEGALMTYLHEPLQDLLLRSVLTGVSFTYHHGSKGGPTLSNFEVKMEHEIDGDLSDEILKEIENNVLSILKPVDYSFDIKFNILKSTFSITLL